jgi:hypothetical protein
MLWLVLRGEKTDVFFYGMGLGEVGGVGENVSKRTPLGLWDTE